MSLPLILTIAAAVALLGIFHAARLWLVILLVAGCGLVLTHNLHLQVQLKNPVAHAQAATTSHKP